jgi:hypothetical protein
VQRASLNKKQTIDQAAALAVITGRLDGSDHACSEGISATGTAPVLALCRKLVEHGYDPATPIHVFRGDVVALIIRSIGEAAQLEINAYGTGFRSRREADAGPSVAPNAPARTGHRARRAA